MYKTRTINTCTSLRSIKEIKNYKASVVEGMMSDIWKYRRNNAGTSILNTIRNVGEKRNTGIYWTESTIVPIYKKGEKRIQIIIKEYHFQTVLTRFSQG